jgi:ribonuclease D
MDVSRSQGGRGSMTAEMPVPDIAFTLCTDADEFRRLGQEWSRCPELWIDTETADWKTSHPRISLLQVRTPEGRLYVVDMLAPGMREALETVFIPAVMADPAIRKWAHNAAYEWRFLGGEQVKNLQGTLRLARSVPYYRLPVRKLTLAALCEHFFGSALDKTHQGDAWGARPLTDEQLVYAAGDPEWCCRVQQALEPLVTHLDPGHEDPAAVRDRYMVVNGRLRERVARRTDIRDAVRDWLLGESVETLGGFRLHRRATARTTLGELIRVAAELDPGQTLAFETPVSAKVAATLDLGDRERVRAGCAIRSTSTFWGPRVAGRETRAIYGFGADEAERIDREYGAIDDERRRLDSEREDLRCRMKAWLEFSARTEWEGFKISEPRERWSMDMHALVALVPAAAAWETAVPPQFRLAFGGGVIDRLVATMSETAFVTWRERVATHLDREAPQSRDWHEAAGSEGEESV